MLANQKSAHAPELYALCDGKENRAKDVREARHPSQLFALKRLERIQRVETALVKGRRNSQKPSKPCPNCVEKK